jgi:uncharacterized protein with FMN-binding domain
MPEFGKWAANHSRPGPLISKASLLLAIALAIFGGAVLAGRPPWGTFTGLALLLVAAAVGSRMGRRRGETYFVEQPRANPRISTTLITLSSAAILAVYTAGYQRTRSAAEKFEAQEQRRPAPATASPAVAAQPPAISTADSYPAPSPEAAPQAPHVTARRAALAPSTSGQSAASPTPAAAPQRTSDATIPPTADAANSGASADAGQPAVAPEPVRYKDGVYLAWGWCRHGNIQASVVISDGKIASTAIAVCDTRYPCAGVIDQLPAQVVTLQSTQVDFVSGATDSSYAFTDAVNNALSKALE